MSLISVEHTVFPAGRASCNCHQKVDQGNKKLSTKEESTSPLVKMASLFSLSLKVSFSC